MENRVAGLWPASLAGLIQPLNQITNRATFISLSQSQRRV